MKVSELLGHCSTDARNYQLHINQFVDDFRRAKSVERETMISAGPAQSGKFEGLVSGVVSYLCRETDTPVPEWVKTTHSPEPFFIFNAKSYELRVRLMLESPPAFRCRNVFVSENYMSRA